MNHTASPPRHSLGPNNIDDDELRMLIAEGIGPVFHARLLSAFGCARAVTRASERELAEVDGIGEVRAAKLRRALDACDPAAERSAMARWGATLLRRDDAGYPALLATIPDPPPALWVRGAFDAADGCCVAIVGSRRCTSYGREQASKISFALGASGFTIVSGGARGIDAAAHRAALRASARTIAVLGCGLAHCYPPEHDELYQAIAAHGAVISESPMTTLPRPEMFPRRNRIISGLALGVIVVEAALRSGALITAREAAESHHREVMALPGPVDSPVSAGCHRAIREGWAGLVTDVEDVLAQLETTTLLVEAVRAIGDRGAPDRAPSALGAPCGVIEAGATAAPRAPPADLREVILEVLRRHGPSSGPAIAARLASSPGPVMAALTMLQLARAVVHRRGAFSLSTHSEAAHAGTAKRGDR
ncbi:MAG: DNA-processing protein DprA [Phycisphaerales bacterium]|jgi:DNA processing protein